MDSTWPPSAKTIASESMNQEHLVDLLRCGMGGRRGGERPSSSRWREEGRDHLPHAGGRRGVHSLYDSALLFLQEGEGPEGSRGARLVWVDKERIVISGFNKLSDQHRPLVFFDHLKVLKLATGICNSHIHTHMHTHTHTHTHTTLHTILHVHIHNVACTHMHYLHTHTTLCTYIPPRLHASSSISLVRPTNRNSLRTLSVYNMRDLKQPLSVVGTNISPATLMPFYDPDTHLLFLTGKVRPYP